MHVSKQRHVQDIVFKNMQRFRHRHQIETALQLLHSSNVGRLDVVLELLDLLLELVERDLVVFDDQVDLELLDTEADRNELRGTPDKTILLNGANRVFEGLHVSLVICRQKLALVDRVRDVVE